MSDEQDRMDDPLPGKEVPLKCDTADECEGGIPRVGRSTGQEFIRRNINCENKKDSLICKVFLGKKRGLSKDASRFQEIRVREPCDPANPFCHFGLKKSVVKKTKQEGVPDWLGGMESDDMSKEKPCSPQWVECHGKRSVG